MITRKAMVQVTPQSYPFKIALIVVVVVPFIAVIAAIWQAWNRFINIQDILLLATSYLVIAAGVTVGLHRYFTHKSFRANRGLEIALAILGSMALEGPLIQWVATHRLHHQNSDGDEDLHSPVHGLFHAHIGWIFNSRQAVESHYAKDLLADPVIVTISRLFPFWIVLSLVIPFLIGGWQGLLWGGLVRIFLVHHFTWSINSICHVFGSRPYVTNGNDNSRNVPWLALFTLGESYHCTHHAFPTSARHADHWWQDISYCIIRGFEKLGLASDIKLPTAEQFARKSADHTQPVPVIQAES